MKKALVILFAIAILFGAVSCEEKAFSDLVRVNAVMSMARDLTTTTPIFDPSAENALDWYYTAKCSGSIGEVIGEHATPVAIENMSYTAGFYKTSTDLGPFSQGIWTIEIYAVRHGSDPANDSNKIFSTGKVELSIRKTADGMQTINFPLDYAGRGTIKAYQIKMRDIGAQGLSGYNYKLEIWLSRLGIDEFFLGGSMEKNGDFGDVTFYPGSLNIVSGYPAGLYVAKAIVYAKLDRTSDDYTVVAGSTFALTLFANETVTLTGDLTASQYEVLGGSEAVPGFAASALTSSAVSQAEGGNLKMTVTPAGFSTPKYTYKWYVDGEAVTANETVIGDGSALDIAIAPSALGITSPGKYTVSVIIEASENGVSKATKYLTASSVSLLVAHTADGTLLYGVAD